MSVNQVKSVASHQKLNLFKFQILKLVGHSTEIQRSLYSSRGGEKTSTLMQSSSAVVECSTFGGI